jgi:DNA-binding NtrC family response regulator
MNSAKRILVVEDEEVIRTICERVLSRMGYETFLAGGIREAAAQIKGLDRLDMLITDMRLPDGDGVDAILLIRQKHPEAKVLIMTGSPNPGDRKGRLQEVGLTQEDVLPKPFEIKKLESTVREYLEGR